MDYRKWECTTCYEIEKPWTDTLDFGCEFYKPVCIVEAITRGEAKAIFAQELEIEFIDVLARVYKGEKEAELPHYYDGPTLEDLS